MFVPNFYITKGITVQRNPDRLIMDLNSVPKDFLKLHHFVTLMEYVMFLNGAPFLITMSRGIKFVTVKHIPIHTAKQLSQY